MVVYKRLEKVEVIGETIVKSWDYGRLSWEDIMKEIRGYKLEDRNGLVDLWTRKGSKYKYFIYN